MSTRRVDDLVKAMGDRGVSRFEVSRMAAELDTKVSGFRDWPLDDGFLSWKHGTTPCRVALHWTM